jgi:hypothetical protein
MPSSDPPSRGGFRHRRQHSCLNTRSNLTAADRAANGIEVRDMQDETDARTARRATARYAHRSCTGAVAWIALVCALASMAAGARAATTSRGLDVSLPTSTNQRSHAKRIDPNTAAPTPRAPQNHFEITAHVVAAGASKASTSACFRMNATIGEPVAGTSTSAHYILKGGFMAPRATRRDEIFSNPFEDCTP